MSSPRVTSRDVPCRVCGAAAGHVCLASQRSRAVDAHTARRELAALVRDHLDDPRTWQTPLPRGRLPHTEATL